jgi:hypothetical protein
MAGIHISPSNLDAASASIPKDTPILMLNLLRFRHTALYPSSSSAELPPTTGKSAYLTRYLPVFQSIAATVDERIQPFWFGNPVGHLVGASDVDEKAREEEWHVAALIRYPSFEVFREVTESERYVNEGLVHRLASLEDWRLVVTVEVGVEELLGG